MPELLYWIAIDRADVPSSNVALLKSAATDSSEATMCWVLCAAFRCLQESSELEETLCIQSEAAVDNRYQKNRLYTFVVKYRLSLFLF